MKKSKETKGVKVPEKLERPDKLTLVSSKDMTAIQL